MERWEIISGELELELREGKEECYSNELTDFRLGGGSGLKVGVVGGEFRATPHHRRRGALDHLMVSLPDLTLTIREERRNQNQMRGREQQRRLDRR